MRAFSYQVVWAVVVAFLLMVGTAAPVLAADPTKVELMGPQTADLGDTVTVQVGVTDGEGRPLPRATVVLFSPASFGVTSAEMRLGQVTTDAAGKASFSYQVRRQGEQVLIGRFAGTGSHAPAETSASLTVQGSAQLHHEEAEIQVPAIGVWLSLLLGGFWTVYLVAMVLVHLIAREGSRASSASGGTYE